MRSSHLPKVGAASLSLLCAAALVWTPTAARAQGQAAPAAGPVRADYRIVPGDALTILVFEKPELSRNVIVPPDGKITYTFLGEVKVAGLTLAELSQLLTQGLKKELVNPQVSVELNSRTKAEVAVLGAIKTPGKRVLEDGWHLLDLIAASGGMTITRPEWTRATLVRADGQQRIAIDMEKLMAGDPEQNLPLMGGDTLLIREQDVRSFSLMIMGEVKRPGMVEVPKSGSFFEIFTSMGGFNPRAATSKVRLTRKGQTVVLDMRSLMTDGSIKLVGSDKGVVTADAITAEPGDILVIEQNEEFFTVWGGVARAGRVEFPEDGKVGVLTALTIAGGPVPGADLKNAAILRQPKEKADWETIPVNLEDLVRKADPKGTKKGAVAAAPPTVKDFALLPGDILFIPVKDVAGRPAGFGLRDVLGMLPFIGWVAR